MNFSNFKRDTGSNQWLDWQQHYRIVLMLNITWPFKSSNSLLHPSLIDYNNINYKGITYVTLKLIFSMNY